jgi:hypothetical protein
LHLKRLFDNAGLPKTKPRDSALRAVTDEVVGIRVLLTRLRFGDGIPRKLLRRGPTFDGKLNESSHLTALILTRASETPLITKTTILPFGIPASWIAASATSACLAWTFAVKL